MDKQDRELLENLLELTISAIAERRQSITDGVSLSVPSDHPLQQMRVLLQLRLKRKNGGVGKSADVKIKKAAELRLAGKSWSEVADSFGETGESFIRDLKAGKKYHERFCLWTQCLEAKAG